MRCWGASDMGKKQKDATLYRDAWFKARREYEAAKKGYPAALSDAIDRSESDFFERTNKLTALAIDAAHLLHQAASGLTLAVEFPNQATYLVADAKRHGALALMSMGVVE